MKTYRPVALIILDGWGIRDMAHGNATVQGYTPRVDGWLRAGERTIVDASGEAVGLPDGQMGNSEVGHLNLGAGRIVYQDLTRINRALSDGSFFDNEALQGAFDHAREHGGKVHLIGLFGPGGVHSHSDHLYGLLEMADRADTIPIVHLITDGRDTPPHSSLGFADRLEAELAQHPAIVASLCGRYFTMDRDKRWQRTKKGYDAIVHHAGTAAPSVKAALKASHADGVTDEFIEPVALDVGDADVSVAPGDSIIFYNFRADRMRQLVSAFAFPDFDGFERTHIDNLKLVTMTQYDEAYPVDVAFPDIELRRTLAEVVSGAGLRQFHAAETEKYAHVTYFFNGGIEKQYPGEERHLEPSPKVATYDLQPEMSAYLLTDAVEARIAAGVDDFILVNFANPDMVGHTGDLGAAIKAVEAVDACAGRLVDAVTARGGVAIVTADHGNCERMVDELTGGPHTYHTTQPVSLLVIGPVGTYFDQLPRGILADVAPTVLALMGVPQPVEMTGRSLVTGERVD